MSRHDDLSVKLKATVVRAVSLPPAVNDEMYALFARHYAETARDRFDVDLAGKDHVVLLRDGAGNLQGFSTLAVRAMDIDGRQMRIVFSGDTIIDPQCWGSQAFAFAWIRLIGRIASEAPGVPLYWLLIVKGHRTYRYLPTFGMRFVPDWRVPDDPGLAALKTAIAVRFFGKAFDPATGIVSHERSQGHLVARLAEPSERERVRADVSFFMQRNPGYRAGDELVCLCPLSPDNMRPLTLRLYQQGFRA